MRKSVKAVATQKNREKRPVGRPRKVTPVSHGFKVKIDPIKISDDLKNYSLRTKKMSSETREEDSIVLPTMNKATDLDAVGGPVVHPKHYNSNPSGVECLDVVQHMSWNVGSAMTYLWRLHHKDTPVQNIKKAIYHLEREIELLQGKYKTYSKT